VAARVDAGYSVTDSYGITATVTAPDGLALTGQDGDGSFSAAAPGILLETDSQQNPYPGLYVSGWSSANQVVWPDLGQSGAYDALYALSYDKSVLAVGFLSSVCSQQIFNNLPAQKFALMTRQ
jgi:hypothetical protein